MSLSSEEEIRPRPNFPHLNIEPGILNPETEPLAEQVSLALRALNALQIAGIDLQTKHLPDPSSPDFEEELRSLHKEAVMVRGLSRNMSHLLRGEGDSKQIKEGIILAYDYFMEKQQEKTTPSEAGTSNNLSLSINSLAKLGFTHTKLRGTIAHDIGNIVSRTNHLDAYVRALDLGKPPAESTIQNVADIYKQFSELVNFINSNTQVILENDFPSESPKIGQVLDAFTDELNQFRRIKGLELKVVPPESQQRLQTIPFFIDFAHPLANNILSNAAKGIQSKWGHDLTEGKPTDTTEDSDYIEIKFLLLPDGNYSILVSNTGEPIPEEIIKNGFTGYSGYKTGGKVEGNGIGMKEQVDMLAHYGHSIIPENTLDESGRPVARINVIFKKAN